MNKKPEVDYSELWCKFRAGDDDAFERLFRSHIESLYLYGIKFISDEAIVKDCIQDLFIKLYNNRGSLSPSVNPKFYLLLSLKNKILDVIRSKNKLKYMPAQELAFMASYGGYPYDEEDDQNEETHTLFREVLSKLSDRQKEAVYLRFKMELSYEEISEIMGISYQSARNLIHRSISAIRKKMDVPAFLLFFLLFM